MLNRYTESKNSKKVFLGEQTYKNDAGLPFILRVVKKAEVDVCKAKFDKVKERAGILLLGLWWNHR